MVQARLANYGSGPSRGALRLVVVGLITTAALIVMGAFAAIAEASSVTSPSVTLVTSSAAGARSEYLIGFTTSSPNGSLVAPNGKTTITFPSGTDITTVSGNTFVRDVTNGNAIVGSCSKSGLVATCGLNGGQSIAAGHQVSIEIDGIINPPAGQQTLAISTTSDVDSARATYTTDPGGQITQPSVALLTSAAAGARSAYQIAFATSLPDGGLSAQGVSQIAITFPTGTDITTVSGNTFVRDVTNGNAIVGSCSKSGLVATCGLNGGQSIAAGHQVSIEIDGIINPPAGPQTLSVKTTSDLPAVPSATYTTDPGGQITQPSVALLTSAAAGARSAYQIAFATSSPDGGLSAQGVSQIAITFPTGTDITTVSGNTFVRDVTNGNAIVGSCSKSGLVATCGLNGGQSIAAGHQVSIEIDGIINPPAGPQTLSVKTTSDLPAVPSATYTTDPGGQITQPSVALLTSAAAGARSAYQIAFATSSPDGGLSAQGVSQIAITFPTGTDITTVSGNTFVRDVTNGNAIVGSCSKSGLVATCGLNGGQSIAAGHQVSIEIDGIINPPAGPQTLSVKTTSDLPAVPSATYTTDPGGQITQPIVTLSNHAPSAAGVQYFVAFATASPDGGLSSQGVSQITVTFPAGTSLVASGNTFVRDVTNGNAIVGSCSKSGLVATCGLNGGQSITAGHQVSIEIDAITNPATVSNTNTVSVRTTSDLPTVNSSNYTIGGNPPPPAVASISPTSGPAAGGTTVTINGANFTGSTVRFGSAPASITGNTGTQLIVTSPPGSGTVDVIVTNGGGSSTPSAADRFTYSAPPPPSTPPVVAGGAPKIATGSGTTLSGTVNPESLATTAFFQYGVDLSFRGPGSTTTLYDQSTPPQQVGSDSAAHTVTAPLTGLVPGALYHVRLVATNTAGTTFGPDQTFTAARAAAPPPPILGKTENAQPVSGTVFIRLASGQFVRLTGAQQIPSGAVIDALKGTLKITTALPGGTGGARDAAAKSKKPRPKVKTQSGNFGGAVFKTTQARNGLANLSLIEGAFKGAPTYATCKTHKAGDASAAALSGKSLQLLRANAHGKFRTTGRYSAATVRGTVWTVADRCDGTLTHDVTDSVAVSDFVRHKTIILRAGQSYLAKAKK